MACRCDEFGEMLRLFGLADAERRDVDYLVSCECGGDAKMVLLCGSGLGSDMQTMPCDLLALLGAMAALALLLGAMAALALLGAMAALALLGAIAALALLLAPSVAITHENRPPTS